MIGRRDETVRTSAQKYHAKRSTCLLQMLPRQQVLLPRNEEIRHLRNMKRRTKRSHKDRAPLDVQICNREPPKAVLLPLEG